MYNVHLYIHVYACTCMYTYQLHVHVYTCSKCGLRYIPKTTKKNYDYILTYTVHVLVTSLLADIDLGTLKPDKQELEPFTIFSAAYKAQTCYN